MGGKGSGGKRTGAGRPRKPRDEGEVPKGRVLTHPRTNVTFLRSAAPAPVVVEEFDAPNELTLDERRVWMELAPHAFKHGTLTPSTSKAFVALCRIVLREGEMAASVLDRCSTKHMNVFREMNKGLDAFGLRPDGKVSVEAPAQAEPQKAAYW
jgi:hypothetical protein